MTITPHPVPVNIRRNSEHRTPGVHLSGIIRAIAVTTNKLKPDAIPLAKLIAATPFDATGSTGKLMKLVTGFAWEEWLAKHLHQVTFHPGEFELDGILATPDGIQFRPHTCPLLHEIKATWTSAKRPFTDHEMWIWQAAGYLKMVSAAYDVECRECVFHPLYVMGRYDGEFPLYEPVLVEFEQREIDELWGIFVENKNLAVPEDSCN